MDNESVFTGMVNTIVSGINHIIMRRNLMMMKKTVLIMVLFSLGMLTLSGCEEPAKTRYRRGRHRGWMSCCRTQINL